VLKSVALVLEGDHENDDENDEQSSFFLTKAVDTS
jgi:hypothetical protein